MFKKISRLDLLFIFIIIGLLISLIINIIPEKYKQNILILILIIIIFHTLLSIYCGKGIEGMSLFNFQTHQIKIFDSSPGYDKPVLDINNGDIIVWMNVGEKDHTVSSTNSSFNSGIIKPGETYSLKFNKIGQYYYYSMDDRGWMKGVINVS